MSILSSTKSGLRNEKLLLTDFNADEDFVVSAYKENMISLPIFYADSYKDPYCRVVASPMSDENNPEFTFYFRFDYSIFEQVETDGYALYWDFGRITMSLSEILLPNIKTIIIDSKYHFNLVKQYVNTQYIEEKKKILQKLQEE